jgi:hypothetical protein
MSDCRVAAARWAHAWKYAWEALDPEPIVALYAADAVFSSQPFREAYRGPSGVRSYVERVFGEEEDVRVRMSTPVVDGDRASVSWWASLREAGEGVTLAGTSVLRFDAEGLVLEQWDAWNAVQELRTPGAMPGTPFAE